MLIVANWKAYVEDMSKAKRLATLGKRLARENSVEIVLAPPAPLLSALALRAGGAAVFAAQDVSVTTGGAHTGESTAPTFAAAGASYAIVGHSERRTEGDSDAIVAEKLAHVLAHALTPILCVGETSRDADGHYLNMVREELASAFAALAPKERGQVIIAYEPLWAIGRTAAEAIAADELAEMVLYIRKVLGELLPGRNAARARILYGGAVEPGNIRALAAASGIDGFLVGHASVDPVLFAALVRNLG